MMGKRITPLCEAQLNYAVQNNRFGSGYTGFAGNSAEKTGLRRKKTNLAVKNESQKICHAIGMIVINRFYENTFDFIRQYFYNRKQVKTKQSIWNSVLSFLSRR